MPLWRVANLKVETGRKHHHEVKQSDTNDNNKTLKRELSRNRELIGTPGGQERLTDSGKQLLDDKSPSDDKISESSTLRVVPGLKSPPASSFPIEPVSPDRAAARESIQKWKSKAEEGGFDDDICIVDPQAHYTELSYLELDVVQASEYFHCQGAFDTAFDDKTIALAQRPHGLLLVPERMRVLIEEGPDYVAQGLAIHSKEDLRSSQQLLDSLWTSYLIFCRVLTSFDRLIEANFCTPYYSILLEQIDKDVAEIVKIPRVTLNNVKRGIERVTVGICHGDIFKDHAAQPDMLHEHLVRFVEEPCSQLLEILHLPTPVRSRSSNAILTLCRALSLLADLGLVSYVGSHANRFDKEYLQKEIPIAAVGDGKSDSLHFDCRTRPLACLRGFLDDEQVWVFRCSVGVLEALPPKEYPGAGLFVLTHIADFADIWGPVWPISPEKGPPRSIQQYNVSKGVICRIDEAGAQEEEPVRCHWFPWEEFQVRRANHLKSVSKSRYLMKDDLLLIGTCFKDNQNCKYTLDHFETDYGHEMGVLGGERSVWEPGLDSRTAGLSFSKIFGMSVTGTQKRRPQTSLKQLTLDKWKSAPQTANPGILNQYSGVEISHCTGNARRVRIKDLLLMSTVWPFLDLYFPKWTSLPWGSAFLAALQSDDPEAVFDVWVEWEGARSEMATLVCCVLDYLDKTGRREAGLVGAFLNNRQESSITFDYRLNDWSSLLRDSHLTATYAVINNACIESHTPDHSTATCGSEAAYTVLGTRIGLKTAVAPELVKVEPLGQLYKTLEKIDHETLRMVHVSTATIAGAYLSSRPIASGRELRDVTAMGGQQYKIFLRASNTSYGGMKTPRSRAQADQTGRTQPSIANQSSRGASSGPSRLQCPTGPSAPRSVEHGEALLDAAAGRRASLVICNRGVDEVVETDAGPSTAPPTVPSENVLSGPNTDSWVCTATNVSPLISQTVESVTSNAADVACFETTSSARSPAAGPRRMATRILGEVQN